MYFLRLELVNLLTYVHLQVNVSFKKFMAVFKEKIDIVIDVTLPIITNHEISLRHQNWVLNILLYEIVHLRKLMRFLKYGQTTSGYLASVYSLWKGFQILGAVGTRWDLTPMSFPRLWKQLIPKTIYFKDKFIFFAKKVLPNTQIHAQSK